MGLRKALRRLWRLLHPQWTAMTPKQIRDVDRAVAASMATGTFHTMPPADSPHTADQLWQMDSTAPNPNNITATARTSDRLSSLHSAASNSSMRRRRQRPPVGSWHYAEDDAADGWSSSSRPAAYPPPRHLGSYYEEQPYYPYYHAPSSYERPRSQPSREASYLYRQSSAQQPYEQQQLYQQHMHPQSYHQYHQSAYSDSGRY